MYADNKDKYLKKYLKYKNKYLSFDQTGGHPEQYYIYFCFKKEKTENALKTLNTEYNTYDIKDIDSNLHLGAYKSNFNNELNLVIAPNSEKKLKKAKKLVRKVFINIPLDIIKMLSRINLMKIIKELEKKINGHEESKSVEPKPVETNTAETKPVESKSVEPKPVKTNTAETKPIETNTAEPKPNETKPDETKQKDDMLEEDISICSILVFKYNQNMSLVLNYKIENNEIIDQDINDNFQISFSDKNENTRKSFFKSNH